jgi:predicted esterase
VGFHEVALEGFEPAIVFYVPGAPKLVITHGAGGHAQWHCQHWTQILTEKATLICPRGKRRSQRDESRGYYYPDHLALSREVHSALAAFESQFERRKPEERYLYVGYSQGASMGALAFAPQGKLFSHLILLEGGYADFSLSLAREFKQSGGLGALFVCGTKICRDKAQLAVGGLRKLGLVGLLRWAEGAGHRPDGRVTQALVAMLPQILAADARWEGVVPAVPHDDLDGNG